jgi:hypothetical protein
MLQHPISSGPCSVIDIEAEIKLRDVHNKVVLDIQRPMRGMGERQDALVPDAFSKDPVKPNDTRDFRIAVDNPPGSWDHNVPEVRIAIVTAEGR